MRLINKHNGVEVSVPDERGEALLATGVWEPRGAVETANPSTGRRTRRAKAATTDTE